MDINAIEGRVSNEDGELRKRCCEDATNLRGAAGLYSTTEDLSKWLKFLIENENIDQKTFLELMTSNLIKVDQSLQGVFYNKMH